MGSDDWSAGRPSRLIYGIEYVVNEGDAAFYGPKTSSDRPVVLGSVHPRLTPAASQLPA